MRFQVLERRVFVPERIKVKEALLLEFLTKKQESWLASKRNRLRFVDTKFWESDLANIF